MKSLYIITGSSSGIGYALCSQLLKNTENQVIGIARHGGPQAANFQFYPLDLADISAIKEFQFPNLAGYSSIHLVNNAGMLGEINTLDKIDMSSLEDVITVNYTAAMLLSTQFIQASQQIAATKTIIHISSGAATGAYASWANYCASKAALEMLSKCIHLEQANKEFPIHSFSISPGVVDTHMQAHIRKTPIEHFPLLPKFEELYQENKLYSPDRVAEKIIEVMQHPDQIEEKVFRIQI